METQKEIPNYSDVKPNKEEAFPNIEKIELASVLNKQIVVQDYKPFPSSMAEGHEFVVILCEVDGKQVALNCGEIVLKQLNEIKDKLPVKVSITRPKGKRYYTLT